MPIRASVDKGWTTEARQVEFVFQYLYDIVTWVNDGTRFLGGSITTGSVYDDEVDFITAFQTRWPGNRDTFRSAQMRLISVLRQLVKDNWLEQYKRYNQQEYYGEARSGWYPCYSLPDDIIYRIKAGRDTPTSMAIQYTGINA